MFKSRYNIPATKLFVALWVCAARLAFSTELSPVKATGIVNAEHGADRSNWDLAPYNSYSFTEIDKIFPTILALPGDSDVREIAYADRQIDAASLSVEDPGTGRPMPLEQYLESRLFNDGLIVIHKGEVVHESYRNNLKVDSRHILMSASKSMTSMVAQIAMQDGLFDENELALKYVPEIRDKVEWQDVTIRHVWDMRDGMKFVEDYDDETSDVRIQDRATGWRPHGPDDPDGMRAFLKTSLNERARPLGEVFNYSSIHTDILAMVVEGASGQPFAEFFESRFWSKIGAANPAGLGTDGFGHPIVQGAISMTLQDFARVAMLVLEKGQLPNGEQLIDASFFEEFTTPNDELAAAFNRRYGTNDGAFYRSFFWVSDPANQVFSMQGVHGQIAYFDLTNDFAFVALGSFPVAVDSIIDSAGDLISNAMLETLTR